MAKRHAMNIVGQDTPQNRDVASTTPDLSAKVKKAIDLIKKPFTTFTKDFAALAQSREELAPKFMKAFGLWQAETAGTFVDFVRYLVPDVGKTRLEYRSHRAYQAADYLRRIIGNASRNMKRGTAGVDRAVAPTDAIAAVLASLMSIIPVERQEEVYNAMKDRLHWTDRQITRVQTQVEHTDPIVQIRARVENLRLTFPAQEPAAEEEPLRRTA